MVVVDLVKNAPASGCERTVMHAGRPAGIGGCEALLAALALPVVAHHEVALHDIDLFPVVVHERLGGKSVGLDLQQPGAAAELVDLVEIRDRKSTRLNSSHGYISYAVFCLKKKK